MKKYIGIISAILIILAFGFWAYKLEVFESSSEQVNKVIQYKGDDGKTALELLKANFTTETQQSGGVETVVSISGKKASANEYWAFFVGEIESSSLSSSYITKTTDVIRWELKPVNTQL